MAYHAHVQYQIAEMVMDMESIAQLRKTADDWSNGSTTAPTTEDR